MTVIQVVAYAAVCAGLCLATFAAQQAFGLGASGR